MDISIKDTGAFASASVQLEPGLVQMLQWLPLKDDEEEAQMVHKRLVSFIENQATSAMVLGANMERGAAVLGIFGNVVGTSLIDDETKPRVKAVMATLTADPRANAAGVVGALSPKQQTKVQSFLA